MCLTFKSALEAERPGGENIGADNGGRLRPASSVQPWVRADFVNIDEDSFKPEQHNGITYDQAMSSIHAISGKDSRTLKGDEEGQSPAPLCLHCRVLAIKVTKLVV